MYGTIDRVPPKPRWGGVYALATAMLAVLGAVEAFVPAGAWRRALEIGLTILGFGAIHLWVRASRRAFDLAGARDAGFRTIVVRPDPKSRTLEQGIDVTGTDTEDSQHVAGKGGRRGGRRWTSSISA